MSQLGVSQTSDQNTQRGVLTTLLEERCRSYFSLVLCIRAVTLCTQYLSETSRSSAALQNSLVQKQVGLATQSGMLQHIVRGRVCIFCTEISSRSVGPQPRQQIAPILQTEVMSEVNTCTHCCASCTEQRRSWPETNIFGWKFLMLSHRDEFKALLPLECH